MSITWGSPEKANGYCMLCGRKEGDHSFVDNKCPNPRASELGQPLFLNQMFEPQVLKGRAKFAPAHFGRRAG